MQPPGITPRSRFARRLAVRAGPALVMLAGLAPLACRRVGRDRPAATRAAAPGTIPVAAPVVTADVGGVDAPARVVERHTAFGADDSDGSESPIDASQVARVIRADLGAIRRCYLREQSHRPTLAGRLDVRLTIGATGRITRLSTSGPIAEAAPAVGECVGERLRSLRYPASEGGEQEFSFPFRFSPDP